jgi:hypothetical protein
MDEGFKGTFIPQEPVCLTPFSLGAHNYLEKVCGSLLFQEELENPKRIW